MIIRSNILDFFKTRKRLALAKLYFCISNDFSNHVHASDLQEISQKLKININRIRPMLKDLERLGVLQRVTKTYWRINSWKKWADDLENHEKFEITYEELNAPGFLNSLFFSNLYRIAGNMSKIRRQSTSNTSRELSMTSARYTKAVTGTPYSLQTLLRNLNRAVQLGLLEVFKSKSDLYSTGAQHVAERILSESKGPYFMEVSKKGGYVVTKHDSHYTSFVADPDKRHRLRRPINWEAMAQDKPFKGILSRKGVLKKHLRAKPL